MLLILGIGLGLECFVSFTVMIMLADFFLLCTAYTALSARKLRAEQLGIMPLMIWLLVALPQPVYQSLKSRHGYSDLTENDQTVFHSSRG